MNYFKIENLINEPAKEIAEHYKESIYAEEGLL